MPDIRVEEFPVRVGDREITARLASPPPDRLAANPALLLTLASDRVTAQTIDPYSLGTETFVAHGHRSVAIDLPNHGQRENEYGQGIVGFRNALVAGQDVFAMLVEDGRALLDACEARGIAAPGRVVIEGTSRGGYMALRLMAADRRIKAIAAHAPVTDWRVLTEFAANRDRSDVAALSIHHYANQLAGRGVAMAMGNHDARVSTARCCQFYLDLVEANARIGVGDENLDFYLTADPGHSLGEEARKWIVDFLVRQVSE